MEELTDKQKEMIDFIKKYINNYGYSPTIRELAYVLGKSVGSVHPMLKKLKAKGVITYNEKMSRTIKVLI